VPLLAAMLAVTSTSATARAALTATPLAAGLAFPNALTVAPDGTIFYGERLTGKIGWIDPVNGTVHPFATIRIPKTTLPGRGIQSLALHPRYPASPYVYVSVARTVNGAGKVQLLRLTSSGGKGTALRTLFQAPAGTDHNASRLAFGPDGKLYMAVGEAGSPATAQDLGLANGKILRMGPYGGIPRENPFGNSRVWAYGLRNTIGMAFDPQGGRLWETDNGPECNDEVNRIVRGGNFGWGPSETCATPPDAPQNTNQDGTSPILPQAWYAVTVGPTGAAFCDAACRLGPGSAGAFFFGTFNTGEIHMLTLTADRLGVAADVVAYTHTGAVLAVESDHHGGIVFSDPQGIFRLNAEATGALSGGR
jgi:glucose/arabinose dehydrogenase